VAVRHLANRITPENHTVRGGGGVLRYVARRLGLGLFTLWAISALTFAIIQLPPGDFVTTYIAQVGESGGDTSAAAVERLRADYGLDQPMSVQYLKWINQILHGNLGTSFSLERPVADVIGDKMVLTVVVSFSAIVLTWVLALPIGIYSAVRRYSVGDYALTLFGFLGLAIPNFLLALALMYFAFSVLGLSVGGLFSPEYETAAWSMGKLLDLLKHLWIPALILGTGSTAQVIRVMRANLLDELGKPYVVTARAKGLPEWRLIAKYPVRVAMNPMASTIGFIFPQIVSGGTIVAVVLSLPTVGPTLLTALQSQDMFLAGAIILLVGVLTVVGMLVSDLIIMLLDPRIRHAG
jgi:peptide/nickel transport system permease protein